MVLTSTPSLQLVFQDVATPLTNTHYLGAQRGAMYSAEHNLERFQAEAVARNRCNTPVKNLYLSGEIPPNPSACILLPVSILQDSIYKWTQNINTDWLTCSSSTSTPGGLQRAATREEVTMKKLLSTIFNLSTWKQH